MKRSLHATRVAFRRVFVQRCFWLFITLLALIVVAPFLSTARHGPLITNLINTFIILSAVAAVGRSTTSFLVVLCLAAPCLVARWLSIETGDSGYYDLSLRLHAAVYFCTIALLLRYVFDRAVMTADRLWGAAATYLMIGILWSFLYAMVDRAAPGSFAVRGTVMELQFIDMIYFSFSTLTTTGFGDIVPLTAAGRTATMCEGIIGQLFLAILIARLAGIYPPRRPETVPEYAPASIEDSARSPGS